MYPLKTCPFSGSLCNKLMLNANLKALRLVCIQPSPVTTAESETAAATFNARGALGHCLKKPIHGALFTSVSREVGTPRLTHSRRLQSTTRSLFSNETPLQSTAERLSSSTHTARSAVLDALNRRRLSAETSGFPLEHLS